MSRAQHVVFLVSLGLAGSARAEEYRQPGEGAEEPRRNDAATVARDGTFNPQTFAARIGDQRVSAMVYGGYDTTDGAKGGNVNAFVEGALFRQVALRVGVNGLLSTDSQVASRNVYSVGLRVGILKQERHGFDMAIGAMYKSTGFTETTGEIEASLLFSRRWSRLGIYGNLIYGQGFISDERDGEVRLGLLYSLGDRVQVGFDGLGRFDLGSGDPNRVKRPGEADFEMLVGPMATVAVGPLALVAQAGSHTIFNDSTGTLASGFAALAGVGAAY